MDMNALIDWTHQHLTPRPHTPCLLVVDEDVARLRALATAAAAQLAWPVVDIGAEGSAALLDLPAPQRQRNARTVVTSLIAAQAPGPLICSEIDLLFLPALRLDPLSLLRHISRRVPLLTFWPGSYTHDVLTYAVAGHSHHRRWSHPDLAAGCIFTLP
jgi:hypothetical protein